ncbi:ABC transporter permease [Streptosporangium sp. NPDC051022]|uniref:ABC transporter permease n=1 Tax=Streptosporangium sp. NPDC051022 TaxID=3155752 RepID=UPI0034481CF6
MSPLAPVTGRWYALPGFVRFTLRRLVSGLLLVLGITVVSFVLTQLVPGDPVTANLGERAAADPAVVAAWRHMHGLDQPLPQQYLNYLGNLLRGDLGTSQLSHRPVTQDLGEFMSATFELALSAIVVALALGVGLGVLAAMRRDRAADQLVRVVSLAGVSVPTFWLSLVALYVFFFKFGLSPGTGRLNPGTPAPPDVTGLYTVDSLISGQWATFGETVAHLWLPALVLAVFTIGSLTRFTRASVLEVLGNDYVRAATAKGLPGLSVTLAYVLRPALVSVITVAGLAFGGLLGGAVLVETVFSWPGLGAYAYRGALALDLPAIMGVSLVVAVVYVVVNFVVDLLYAVLDPRIRLG